MSDTSKLTVLGHAAAYRYENPEPEMLESFANLHTGEPWVVGLDCGEFTSLCPMTGQPDFGRIRIQYIPDRFCVESKSLKLYLGAYRNEGSFHEDCVNRIASDLQARIEPRYLRVLGDFKARGGIAIRPLAVRRAPDLGPEEEARCVVLLGQYDSITSESGPSESGPSESATTGLGTTTLG
jgi:7-cyano-7-deazaguanine reductase